MTHHDLFRVPVFKHLAAVIAVCAGLLCAPSLIYALSVQQSAFNTFMAKTVGAGKQTVGFGTGGVPVVATGVPTLAATGSANLQHVQTGKLLNPSGNPYNFQVVSKVTPADVALVVGSFLGKLSAPLTVGSLLYTALQELGIKQEVEPSTGAVTYKRLETINVWRNDGYAVTASTVPALCLALWPQYGGYYIIHSATQASCLYGPSTSTSPCSGCAYVIATSTQWIPLTLAQLQDYIASTSGWPTTSTMPQALAEIAPQTQVKLNPIPETITGDATSTGPTTTTTDSQTGKTTTKTPKYDHTYTNPDTIGTTSTDTALTYDPSTGQTTSVTTVSTPTEQVPFCQENPGSIACAELDVPTDQIPKTTKNITYATETLFGGGSCPADKTMTIHGQTIKVVDWQANCGYLVNYARPVLLTAAAFMAMLIVLGAKVE